jgi:AraC-like DNA-binding protein
MFRAEIKAVDKILLECSFEEGDYPLINLSFSDTRFIKRTIDSVSVEVMSKLEMEENISLEITVSQSFIAAMIKDPRASSFLVITGNLSSPIRNILADMLHYSLKPEFKEAYLKLKITELFIRIWSAQEVKPKHHNWSLQDRQAFEKVRVLIAKNLNANYSIEELAIVASMNRTKLQEGFKNMFNKTIFAFASDYKLTEARAMLTQHNSMNLKEIAATVGYKHVNHFSAAFKKKFLVSPSHYRKENT